MKKSIRTFLTVLLTVIFLFSTIRFFTQQREKAAGSDIYNNALSVATSGKAQTSPSRISEDPASLSSDSQWAVAPPEDEDPYIQSLEALDLEALRDVNPDVIGWILIPDTQVNYPLMAGSENNYYLNHTWNKESYNVGSIFLEHLCTPDFTDFHTIVYGHNMNDGSMFGSLLEYRNPEHLEAHPYVYIRSDQGVFRYEIFSGYFASINTDTYGVGFSSDGTKVRFLDFITEKSLLETDIQPETTDRILTLSTCSGRGSSTRWVLHARLKTVLHTPG